MISLPVSRNSMFSGLGQCYGEKIFKFRLFTYNSMILLQEILQEPESDCLYHNKSAIVPILNPGRQ